MKRIAFVLVAAVTLSGGIALATPGSGLVPTEVGRRTVQHVHIDESKPSDIVVVTTAYEPGGYSGWHSHPGPVVVAVTKGQLKLTNGDCKSKTYHKGDIFREHPGQVYNGVDNGKTPTTLVATYFGAPVGGEVRIDEPDPGC
jgi:quercetin dioxygenase-like cupin family protein